MQSILNIITSILSYSDTTGVTDNPQRRAFDYTRKFSAIPVTNPASDMIQIQPGDSYTLFDGIRTNSLSTASVLSMVYVGDSVYKIVVTSGPSGFRTRRSISGLSAGTVTVNNNSVATFVFTGATIVGAIPGDILRISGACCYDTGPFAYSPLNAGKWRILAISGGNTVQATRLAGVPFSGVTETVTGITSAQVDIFSAAGVQPSDKFDISGAFSPASQRTYEVLDARPDTIFFTSMIPLPQESGIAYPDPVLNGASIVFYSNAKAMFYFETDQDVVVQFNGDTGSFNKVTPIQAGSQDLVGYMHTYGTYYKAVIVNKSMNIANIKFFMTE